ncbi:hypothetical protein DFP72DRAFT_1149301 [Ephemerocybe angulata]|uniref:F-box domain-containing protein n=1 Tax=Ephemerocybe angulata TaxID=980116 RepID=A0A8H6HI25_9AGAR|nr:hypothetical protein DFP72DRAFT_1149301 [Tulosesus angulatus]
MSEDGTPSISYLLDSNTPPKPVEIPVVESRIRDLVDKISELRKLEVELERHRAILSPVRRVPREVLGYVFTFLHPYEHEEKVRDAAGRKDILRLSLVCKLWRDATLVTHELWTGLQIKPRHTLESLKPLETWLSQAGSLPRRLQYQGWNLRDGEASTNVSRQSCSCGSSNAWTWTRRGPGSCLLAASVLPQLLTNGPRLDHLTLMCANTVCFGHFLDTMDALRQIPTTPGSRPWDTLRSLSVKFQNTILLPDPQLGHIIVSHLERLPVVESLEVHIPSSSSVFETGFDTSHLELNILPNLLERLTTFEICCSWAGPHILKLLRHCSNIETLTINYGSSGDLSPLRNMGGPALIQHYRAAPLVLAKLRTLRTRRARHLSFLYFLEAPQLVNLDIGIFSHENGLNGYDLLLPFQSFRDRSGFTQSLRTFQLRACFIDAGQLFPIISNLTGLTTLTLDNVKVEMDRLWKKFKDRDAAAQRGYGDLSFSNLEKLEILQLPPGCQLEPIVDYIKKRGPSLKFQLITSYKILEHRVLSEEDVRQTLRFSLSGVRASIVPSV